VSSGGMRQVPSFAPESVAGRFIVVIPAYGLVHLTQAVVSDALREPSHAVVLVVDNEGDYMPVHDEVVYRPGQNLGWLRASNIGMAAAREARAGGAVLLNNDTRLCAGFFAGLAAAQAATSNAILAPLYDDISAMDQHHELPGGISSFVPEDRESPSGRIDGTCVLVPLGVINRIGLLDERHFGRHGWGGIDDYCLRSRRNGLEILVTHRSFLSHISAASAAERTVRYEYFAHAEMLVGMARKYGLSWRENFEPGTYGDRRRGELIVAVGRSLQERVGLAGVEWRRLLRRNRDA
jgi:GT2 family glycosyltransferase